MLQIILFTFPSWCFLADIVLNFNTGYYFEGILVTKRYDIARNYLKSTFCLDIIVFGLFAISQFDNIRYLNLILLLRMGKILQILGRYE
jgi:potassium voltage-gated channel Eag-related subfamily H protein 5